MIAWSLFLLFGAWLGHTVIMVFTMNWLYSRPFPKFVVKPLRKVYLFLIASGCAYLGWIWFAREGDWARLGTEGPLGVWAYVWLCWLAGFVLFPVATINNSLIQNPPVLIKTDTRTVDVAKELGFLPAGHGKRRVLATLPYNQCFQVDFSERTLLLPQIPAAWDGLKILHLSDLHFCGTPDRVFYEFVIERCNKWEVDIVAMTGDVVDTDKHHRWIVPLLGRLSAKIVSFGILGNHDAWLDVNIIRRRLRRIGMHVLGNGWETIEIRGEPMVVIGNESPWFAPAPDLAGCPPQGFRLCLSHTPDNIVWANRNLIDLVLAGHVHGGQIRLPVTGSIFVPSKYSRRYDRGTFQVGPTAMHVSRGLAGETPLRYNCRPEVTLVQLKK
jgi:predicted MPP superfamily phosphohydrolase